MRGPRNRRPENRSAGTRLAMLTIDVTLRSAVGRDGEARPQAAEVDGAVLLQVRTDKDPELTTGRCRLVMVAIETGGRWSEEAVDLLWQLSCAKARDIPHFVTHQAGSSLGTAMVHALSGRGHDARPKVVSE